ncbi:MAG: M23 family metallopeptidase [Spirochaetaceae bacterium]|nr:MAG: M23 family metallopeptidase [Spirochaetaceae bacterium]
MKPILPAAIILAVCGVPSLAALQLHAPALVERGTAFLVHLDTGEGIDSLQTEVVTQDGTRIATSGGFVVEVAEGLPVWVSLLGVPSTVASGEYVVRVTVSWGDGTFIRLQRPIQIGPRVFSTMRIALNQALTNLRSVPDPRQVAEARTIIDLVARHDPLARFEKGPFIVPVDNARVSAGFGDRRVFAYADGGEAQSIHLGIDLAAPIGTPVASSGAGRVAFAGERIITGNSVVIEHLPGMFGLYYHLDSIEVQVGQVVQRGDLIGTVGMTGLATGPHLHWEFRVGGTPVDPEPFVNAPVVDKEAIFRRMGEQ